MHQFLIRHVNLHYLRPFLLLLSAKGIVGVYDLRLAPRLVLLGSTTSVKLTLPLPFSCFNEHNDLYIVVLYGFNFKNIFGLHVQNNVGLAEQEGL